MAAYNAGLSPITRWNTEIRDGGDPLLWMESIPYWETRGYVSIVMRNYWMYERAGGRRIRTAASGAGAGACGRRSRGWRERVRCASRQTESICVAIDPERVFKPINIAVLTVSDTRDAADDTSGDLLAERIKSAGHTLADPRDRARRCRRGSPAG